MLVNATQPEELRVALIDGQSIYDFDLEQQGQERKRSNIYKAKVSRVEKSLGAAFVDFGSEKHGFLPIKELAPSFFGGKQGKKSISECLTQGQELIVQVDKEERGAKGAALSTLISLPGHYLVLMPNNPEAGGISRTIEGEEREKVKENFRELKTPKGMGLIMRTAAKGATLDELKWDLEYLLSLWEAIKEADHLKKAPFLIYRDDDLISRSLRDFLREDITEVLVDTDAAFDKAYEFASILAPELKERIKRYDESIPLFTRYQVESQIESAYQREVKLHSGGSIVIDQTEALVSIDINSAKATGGSDIEDTALKTNVEAAKEIGKQLRLRDIGGLIVIDFIDMNALKNKRAVEEILNESVSIDRAKIQLGRISRFGLLEMSRQRLRPSLQERWTNDINSLSTAVLRLIEEEAGKKKSGEVRAVVSSDMSVFLLNERRSRINEIEERSNTRVVVVPDPVRSDNRFEVIRLKKDDRKAQEEPSYDIQGEMNKLDEVDKDNKTKTLEKAVVDISPKRKPRRKQSGFISKLINKISGKPILKEKSKKVSKIKKQKPINKARPNIKKSVSNKGKRKPVKENTKENLTETRKDNKKLNEKKKHDKSIDRKKSTKPNEFNKQHKKQRSNLSKPKSENKEQEKKKTIDGKQDKKEINKQLTKPKAKTMPFKEPVEKEIVKTKEEPKKAKDWGRALNDPRNKEIK